MSAVLDLLQMNVCATFLFRHALSKGVHWISEPAGAGSGLTAIDRSILLWIQGTRHAALDGVMLVLGSPWALLPVLVPLAFAAVRAGPRRRALGFTFLAALAAVACADGAGHLLKLLFARPRPCRAIGQLNALAGCGDSFSFPSNHAANAFAVAALFAQRAPRWRWAWFGVAAVLGCARLYVGAHYPTDVIAGAALGIAVGAATAAALPLLESRSWRLARGGERARPSPWRSG